MKIALITHYNDAFACVGDITSPLYKEYCDKHNYRFTCYRQHLCPPDFHSVWNKIWVTKDALLSSENFDYVMYCDADSMPMNFNITLESIIDSEHNLFIANDVNGLNSAVYILKNCQWSLDFLDNCWSRRFDIPNRTEAEQTAMKQYMSDFGFEHIKIVPQSTFNSFLYDKYGYSVPREGHFEKGQFILHLPGMQNHERVPILNEYKQYIVK